MNTVTRYPHNAFLSRIMVHLLLFPSTHVRWLRPLVLLHDQLTERLPTVQIAHVNVGPEILEVREGTLLCRLDS